jgi:tight adherence protein B
VTVLYLLLAGLLCALVLLVQGAWMPCDKSDSAQNRLARYMSNSSARRAPIRGIVAQMDRRLVRARALAVLERSLHEAGIPLTVSEALLALVVSSSLLVGSVGAARGAGAAGMMAGAFPLLVWAVLASARDRRIRRLDSELPAALDLLVGQLRAHRSIAVAILEVGQQVSPLLRREFTRVAEEIRLGLPLSHALDGLRRRIPSRALRTVVTAILVAERTGGNLAEFLSRQSEIVRSQVAFLQDVRALTAHARSTAAILSILPIGVALALYVLEADFFSPMLTSGLGRAMLACAIVMEMAGWWVIRSMVRSVER